MTEKAKITLMFESAERPGDIETTEMEVTRCSMCGDSPALFIGHEGFKLCCPGCGEQTTGCRSYVAAAVQWQVCHTPTTREESGENG